jgi:murein DD-endopeptidase MepM/ murein hydrolase activator NlpD
LITILPADFVLKFRRFYLKSEITQQVEANPSPATNREGLSNQTNLPGNHRHHASSIAIGAVISVGVCGLLGTHSTDRVTASQEAIPVSVPRADSGRIDSRSISENHAAASARRVKSVLPLASNSAKSTVAFQNPYLRQLPSKTVAQVVANRGNMGAPVAEQPNSVQISVPTPKSKMPVRYGQNKNAKDPYLSHSGSDPEVDFGGSGDPSPRNSQPSVGFSWPAQGSLTSRYGRRWGRMHKGIDIAGPVGTPINTAADGTVISSGWSSGGYGNLIEIRHSDGSTTRYGHNSRLLVSVGQQVRQGQQIAEMGSTGRSTGSHLHFEIRSNGTSAVNPIAYLPANTGG